MSKNYNKSNFVNIIIFDRRWFFFISLLRVLIKREAISRSVLVAFSRSADRVGERRVPLLAGSVLIGRWNELIWHTNPVNAHLINNKIIAVARALTRHLQVSGVARRKKL